MTKYEVTAVKSGKWWSLSMPDFERVYSQCKRLDEAPGLMADILLHVHDLKVDESDIMVTNVTEPGVNI